MSGYGMSIGCNCCGCALWTADFGFSLVDEKPVDRQYYYPLDRVGIREGNPGYGLLYDLESSQRWDVRGQQYVIPLLDSHPDPGEVAARLIGETGLPNGTYTYKALLAGVERHYRIDAAGTVTLLSLGAFILPTLSFNPWQARFTHELTTGGEPLAAGVLLQTGEQLQSLNTLPASPWHLSFSNTMSGSMPVTETPFWLGSVGSGLEFQLCDSDGTVVASFVFMREAANPVDNHSVPYPSSAAFDIASTVSMTVTIDGDETRHWLPGFETSIFEPLEFTYVPGVIGIRQASKTFAIADGAAIKSPPIFDNSYTYRALTLDGPVSLRILPVTAGTIITNAIITASRMTAYQSTLGVAEPTPGQVLSTVRECSEFIACPSVYPHASLNFEVSSASCSGLSLTTGYMVIRDGCSCSIGGQSASTSTPAVGPYEVEIDFEQTQTDQDFNEDGFVDLTTFDHYGSLTGDTNYLHGPSVPNASLEVEASVMDDAEDGEFVYVTATASVRVHYYQTNAGMLDIKVQDSHAHRYTIAGPTITSWPNGYTELVGYRCSTPSGGVMQLSPVFAEVRGRYRKRVPRWKDTPPTLTFTSADLIEWADTIDEAEWYSSASASMSLVTIGRFMDSTPDVQYNELYLRVVGTNSGLQVVQLDSLAFDLVGVEW